MRCSHLRWGESRLRMEIPEASLDHIRNKSLRVIRRQRRDIELPTVSRSQTNKQVMAIFRIRIISVTNWICIAEMKTFDWVLQRHRYEPYKMENKDPYMSLG